MADIKFMDISENSNPATTDSILVGNKDNGLKRTSLGNLADMFAVHGLFHFESVTTMVKAQTASYPIEAPTVEGYKFAFWLSTATVGWMGATYIESPTSQQNQIWIVNTPDSDLSVIANGNNRITAIAVYIKNSVA